MEKEKLRVMIKDLKPGDYVVQAKATVKEVDASSVLTIIDFTDNTATAPMMSGTMVDIER